MDKQSLIERFYDADSVKYDNLKGGVTLVVTDSILHDPRWIHLNEDAVVLKQFCKKVTHIHFIGRVENVKQLGYFLENVEWEQLCSIRRENPMQTKVSPDLWKILSLKLCAEITSMTELTSMISDLFIGHTMIWLDHVHVKTTPERFQSGIVNKLKQRRYFHRNKFSVTSYKSVSRIGHAVVIMNEEFICHPIERKGRMTGYSLISDTDYTFGYMDCCIKTVITPFEKRDIFEPIYDRIIYYPSNLADIDRENLAKCQLLAKQDVVILMKNGPERDKLNTLQVLNI